jgi:hypothetical protein
MAIFSACSDLETRQLLWIPRNPQTDQQQWIAGRPTPPLSAAFWAKSYGEAFAGDVKGALLD